MTLGAEPGQPPPPATAMARSAVPGEATTRSGADATVAARTAAGCADPSRPQRALSYRLRQRGGRLAANAVHVPSDLRQGREFGFYTVDAVDSSGAW